MKNKIYEMDVNVSLTVKTCPVCYVLYAVPQELLNRKNAENGSWYCPNGHSLIFCESKLSKAEKELENAKSNANYWQKRKYEADAEKEILNRQISAKKGQITKLKNRVANGVCPCCNRHFMNLQRHIQHQHPTFVKEDNA